MSPQIKQKINWPKAIQNWVIIVAIVIATIYAVVMVYAYLKPIFEKPVITTTQTTESRLKQDSIQKLIDAKNSALANSQKQIDSLKNDYEKLTNKPLPTNLRNATVSELDSFWNNYKANW